MKSLVSYDSKVIAKVKVDNRQTGQKQYAHDLSMRRHKNKIKEAQDNFLDNFLLILVNSLIQIMQTV